jgi:hypothetical protein
MPAIISDQFRILNTETFVKSLVSVGYTSNNYYVFIGQPNSTNTLAGGSPSNWPTPPLDGFNEENLIKQTIVSLKKVTSADVSRVVPKLQWTPGTIYDMYRNNYTIYNLTNVTSKPRLYDSNYFVINENLQVYICLNNGSDPDNLNGKPSFDEPTFVDLEPRQAGTSGDGYIWKYLYTIKPSQIIKFDSIEYMPVPEDWGSSGESLTIKNNAINGKIYTAIITGRGSGYQSSQSLPRSFSNIPILGDGKDGTATITVDSTGSVSDVYISNGGSGYTKGKIDFRPGGIGIPDSLSNTGTIATFDVIIPPKGGHGYDIYRELGAYRALIYSRFQKNIQNPDTIDVNDFGRVGIIKNPTVVGSDVQLLTDSEVSGLSALKLSGITTETTYGLDSIITQNVGFGSTAIGFVASWDSITGVLKYYQPVGLATDYVNYTINQFTSNPDISTGGELIIHSDSSTRIGPELSIDKNFNGSEFTINNNTYQLGLVFNSGIASAEYNTKSGEIIYIDNINAVPLSPSQKEDIKIVLEF